MTSLLISTLVVLTDLIFNVYYKRTNCTSARMRRSKRSTLISDFRERASACATFPILLERIIYAFFDAGTRIHNTVQVQYAVTRTRHPRFLDTTYM
jgi:hypothetical protein